jgi:hypothetical protein
MDCSEARDDDEDELTVELARGNVQCTSSARACPEGPGRIRVRVLVRRGSRCAP